MFNNNLNARGCITMEFIEVFLKRKRNEDNSLVYQKCKETNPDSVPNLTSIPFLRSYIENNSAINIDMIYDSNTHITFTQPNKRRKRLIGETDDSYERDSFLANGTVMIDGVPGGTGDMFGTVNGIPSLDQISVVEILEIIFYALSIISNEKQNFEDHQADMLMRMIMANLKNLFKESVLEHFDYLKKTFASVQLHNLYQLLKDLILLARRRGGKTSTLCALLACIMAILPGQNILFFSTSERISLMGREKITEFLDVLIHTEASRKFANVQYKTGKETLRVKTIFGTWNKGSFFPDNKEVRCLYLCYLVCFFFFVFWR